MISYKDLSCLLLLILAGPSLTASGQSGDPMRFVRWSAGDVGALAQSAWSSRSALVVGIAGSTVLLASQFDRTLARHSRQLSESMPRRMRKVLHESGNVDLIRPLAVVVFLGSLTSGNEYFQDAAFTSMEAVIYANLVTQALKFVAGRERPSAGVGSGRFKPFSGARSLPSGHATTVFAFAMPWLIYYPGVASVSLITLGVGTALVRMADDYHWLSDVLAGGLIGGGMGYLLSRRHQNLVASPVLALDKVGLRLVVRL